MIGGGVVAGRGIIPARAGFTVRCAVSGVGARDHPRSRGVYVVVLTSVAHRRGSSPLARGLRRRPVPLVLGLGIIPARAGFTQAGCSPAGLDRDHPRSRGVYGLLAIGAGAAFGSSPLARGLRRWVVDTSWTVGIIPARAGFTGRTTGTGVSGWDHPRSRGVYVSCMTRFPRNRGSSPLARGLRLNPAQPPLTPRIIPARAGFTPGASPGRGTTWDHPRSRGVYSGTEGRGN